MSSAFPLAQVDPGPGEFAALVGFDLPDDNDRHVIAAALAAEAQFICTLNVGDFPEAMLDSLGLSVATPDDLLCPLVEQHPDSMRWVQCQALRYLPGSTDESTVEALGRAGSPKAASVMAKLLGVDDEKAGR
ncbi:MAG: hypothetical protein LBG60_11980 [Bifidobacteriaceae bacterium]|jgi:hypothetical protein|nr:hypothetical protein [Bifidobacteriaceae bacterium]